MEKQAAPQRSKGGYLEAMLNACPDAIIAINDQGTITFANKEACHLVEREMCDLVGENIADMYESLEAARETNRKLYMSGGIIHDHESKAKTKSGKIVPIRISASQLRDAAGNSIGAVGYFAKYRPWTAQETHLKSYAEELEAKLEEWKDLGAPVFELYPELAVVVIVGRVDSTRFERIASNLLKHIKDVKTRAVLIDLSSALISEDSVAAQLIKTVRIIYLLGVHCVLAGVETSVAKAMEGLLTDLTSVKSFYCTDLALQAALNSIGYEICRQSE